MASRVRLFIVLAQGASSIRSIIMWMDGNGSAADDFGSWVARIPLGTGGVVSGEKSRDC